MSLKQYYMLRCANNILKQVPTNKRTLRFPRLIRWEHDAIFLGFGNPRFAANYICRVFRKIACYVVEWALVANLLIVFGQSLVTSWWSMLSPLVLVILLVSVLDFYVEAVCGSKLEISRACRFGAFATFTGALCLSVFWNHPFVSQVNYGNTFVFYSL